MNLRELKANLLQHPGKTPRFILPGGDEIPAHAHVTEVGHVKKNFVDCGGLLGQNESVVVQTWLGDDTDHRLTAERFAKILALGERVLPHDDLRVEVEYDCCVVAQYPITRIEPRGDQLEILLGNKRTQCLARERREAAAANACCQGAGCC